MSDIISGSKILCVIPLGIEKIEVKLNDMILSNIVAESLIVSEKMNVVQNIIVDEISKNFINIKKSNGDFI